MSLTAKALRSLPVPAGTVSSTSAQRFAARVRARRRRRRLVVALVLLIVLGLGWSALRSPWATVRTVEVTGTARIPAHTVRAAAEPELGHPLLLVRRGDVRARITRLRLVRAVTVERHWPSGLRIRVTERQVVAAVPAGSKVALVDRDGVVIERVANAPAGTPRLELSIGAAGVDSLRGCLAVLNQLPPELKQRVRRIGAGSPDGIWLILKGGARVDWGSADRTPLKARVLAALLPQKAVGYDVRSPGTPAVRSK